MYELKLVINFIILSIENRAFIPDEQAYLKWLCAFLGYLSDGKINKIEIMYNLMGALGNVPQKDIEKMIKTLRPKDNEDDLKKLK